MPVIVLSVHVQEIADITNNGRSPHNLQRLSPAICPDCNNPVADHTMTELYEREWRTPSEPRQAVARFRWEPDLTAVCV